MNTYPALPMLVDSAETRATGRQVDRASNGVPHVRAMYTAQKKSFSVRHAITAADKATLEAFFTANALVAFSFVWNGDGVTYTCLFAEDPVYAPLHGQKWDVRVALVEA